MGMESALDRLGQTAIDRRTLVKAAAIMGAVSGVGLMGADNSLKEADATTPTPADLEQGEWVTFNCTTPTCAYRCHNQAYVVDGTIVRQGTGNTHPDSPDFPQCRPCIKGMSTRRIVTAPERLKYPMKRKHWQPGGTDYHPEMRGVDEWERISWDEATDIIASELLRVRDTYGNRSFLALGELEPRLGGGLHGSPILVWSVGRIAFWFSTFVGIALWSAQAVAFDDGIVSDGGALTTLVVLMALGVVLVYTLVLPGEKIAAISILRDRELKTRKAFKDMESTIVAVADRAGLSPREREVFSMLAHGRDTAYIQERLFISQGTVRSHRDRIYRKLNVHSKQELLDLVEREFATKG